MDQTCGATKPISELWQELDNDTLSDLLKIVTSSKCDDRWRSIVTWCDDRSSRYVTIDIHGMWPSVPPGSEQKININKSFAGSEGRKSRIEALQWLLTQWCITETLFTSNSLVIPLFAFRIWLWSCSFTNGRIPTCVVGFHSLRFVLTFCCTK